MKTIILYIALIGILFIGLLAILRLGEKIKAPQNVSGKWRIDAGFVNSIHNSCTPVYLPKKDPLVQIEQSGIHLTVYFNDPAKTELHGKLANDSMFFEQELNVKNDFQNLCGKKTKADLSAVIEKLPDNSYELIGTWSNPDCKESHSIEFNAVEIPKGKR